MRRILVFLVAAALLAAPTAVAAELRAEQITPAAAPDVIIGGMQSVGGIGDWYLANDVVEIIVDDPSRRIGDAAYGGNLIDAGLRDRRDEDQMALLMPILNLSQNVLVPFARIRAEVNTDEGWARLLVSSDEGLIVVPESVPLANRLLVPDADEVRGIYMETEYKVYPGEPYVHLTTTIVNRGAEPAPIFSFSDLVLRNNRSMRAFTGNTLLPEATRGYHHASFNPADLLKADSAISGFTFLTMPGVRQFTPISYALCAPDRVERGLPNYGVSDDGVSVSGVLLADPDWDTITTLRLLRARGYTLAPGASWTYHRLFVIGGRADVASTTDVIFPLLDVADGTSGVQGRVEPAAVQHVIAVSDARTGTPVTQITTVTEGLEAGAYRAVLPPGKYALEFRAPHRPSVIQEVIVSVNTFADAGVKRLDEPGWLVFDPAFRDGGPGRIIVQGQDSTPDPVFEPELLDFQVDGETPVAAMETNSLYFVGNKTDPVRVPVLPGTYLLTTTRGLEYGVTKSVVTVPGPGANARVTPALPPRVIDLPEYLTADFHVHSQASGDSAVRNATRLRTFVANGLDVLTATEHDTVGDFEPALDAVGVRDRLRVIHGSELTGTVPNPHAPFTIGHSNVWPVTRDPLASFRGAPPSENLSLAAAYEGARRDYGVEVIQLNHPLRRTGSGASWSAYLTHLGDAGEAFNPEAPVTAAPNNRLLQAAAGGTRAIDFDAIEVMNGGSMARFARTRPHWYAMLKQGLHRAGTANSDTHSLRRPVGYPRNYVYFPGGLAEWDASLFNRAVREGRMFGTTGPLIVRFTVNGAGAGDVVTVSEATAAVAITVAAAPWVPVEEVRLVVNGDVRETFRDLPALAGAAAVRLQRELTLELEHDSFITLEAGAALPGTSDAPAESPGGAYAAIAGSRTIPIAFANPIYVDVDGNGRFDAPGVPPIPPGWFVVNIPWYVFAAVVAFMVIGLWMARRES